MDRDQGMSHLAQHLLCLGSPAAAAKGGLVGVVVGACLVQPLLRLDPLEGLVRGAPAGEGGADQGGCAGAAGQLQLHPAGSLTLTGSVGERSSHWHGFCSLLFLHKEEDASVSS